MAEIGAWDYNRGTILHVLVNIDFIIKVKKEASNIHIHLFTATYIFYYLLFKNLKYGHVWTSAF